MQNQDQWQLGKIVMQKKIKQLLKERKKRLAKTYLYRAVWQHATETHTGQHNPFSKFQVQVPPAGESLGAGGVRLRNFSFF